ncbi:hypothetical protein [Flavobacterium gawalongense]|uniref:Uncharacterized protein n=1 Tax=Flavobacterium gawalongense TaxID=2594432 RepID=A0A553B9R0_9FLAO|nr:hypothetical protein [Flavobacterium gawalongense]TRW96384.1 hypothetical protein FNW33_17225 [Flavobacterium gawalongense]TRX01037.1 hypothetical protein FNW12_17315 [Flavobacterium gawalongense]TRX04996.1 hypothetical protein FNW11_16870 [Flavobacterium gawalongense]TRX05796.1 hypothetical protein FNW10_16820 [Flavobacterium gawalongense]TRX21482.1 hypothetical protein FNW38_16920 [Flavobacterium gawalongense]
MIKVYLDWNVMSGMKNNHFTELNDIILNKDKFLLLYSTSHIGDIFASIKDQSEQEQKMVKEDLDYITFLTDDLCLVNDSKEVVFSQYQPRELLDDRIREAPLFEDFSLDNLFSSIEEGNPMFGIVDSMKNMIASTPLDLAFKEAFENPESAAMLDKMFPGLKEDQTMNGFFKSFGKMFHNMNETEDYKDLRNMVQQIGVNSGHFNENKNPFEVIDNAYKKIGVENSNVDKYFEKGKNAPEWFDDITNEYIKLDMHGFKADKVKVTAKEKNTFNNTTEDASHSAFASRCEFYITNDDKNYHKTKAVFQKLGIFTIVLKPNEFIQYYNFFLNVNSFDGHYKSIIDEMKRIENFQEQRYQNGESFGWVNFTNQYFFNFFNKILIPNPETNDALFVLGKESPSKRYIISHKEIEGMLKLFVNKLGIDINGKSYFEVGEINTEEDWTGRTWELNFGQISIKRLNGWFQMYFFPLKEGEKQVEN